MAGQYGHPSSWRLHRAHPALGLQELGGERLSKLRAHDLGAAWLALKPEERRRREADFVTALRSVARAGSGHDVEVVAGGASSVLGVRMDRWKAPKLERELLYHVWERAHQREMTAIPELLPAPRDSELGRTLRAHVRVGLSWLGHRVSRHPVSSLAAAAFVAVHVAGLFM